MMSLRCKPNLTDALRKRSLLTVKQTRAILDDIFLEDIHAKRVASLANGVAGALAASRASIHAIGRAYAELEGIQSKSAVKQIDRLLSNEGIEIDLVFSACTASCQFRSTSHCSLIAALAVEDQHGKASDVVTSDQ